MVDAKVIEAVNFFKASLESGGIRIIVKNLWFDTNHNS